MKIDKIRTGEKVCILEEGHPEDRPFWSEVEVIDVHFSWKGDDVDRERYPFVFVITNLTGNGWAKARLTPELRLKSHAWTEEDSSGRLPWAVIKELESFLWEALERASYETEPGEKDEH